MARDSSPIRRTDAEEVEVALVGVEATFVEMDDDAGANAATSCADKAMRPNSCQDGNFIVTFACGCEDEYRSLIEFRQSHVCIGCWPVLDQRHQRPAAFSGCLTTDVIDCARNQPSQEGVKEASDQTKQLMR